MKYLINIKHKFNNAIYDLWYANKEIIFNKNNAEKFNSYIEALVIAKKLNKEFTIEKTF